jgi:hypothetical protein
MKYSFRHSVQTHFRRFLRDQSQRTALSANGYIELGFCSCGPLFSHRRHSERPDSRFSARCPILQEINPTVQIVANQQGLAAYSPNQITVSINEVFKLVNKTTLAQTISGNGIVSFTLAPGTSRLLSFNHTGQFQLTLASTHATLTVNVVPFRG